MSARHAVHHTRRLKTKPCKRRGPMAEQDRAAPRTEAAQVGRPKGWTYRETCGCHWCSMDRVWRRLIGGLSA